MQRRKPLSSDEETKFKKLTNFADDDRKLKEMTRDFGGGEKKETEVEKVKKYFEERKPIR